MSHAWSLPFLMAASLALFACQSPPTVNVEVPTSQATTSKGIFVTGEGEVTVTPDLAVLSLQVQVRDARAGAAWNRAAQASKRCGPTRRWPACSATRPTCGL